ncbi:HAD family hydrolase [Wenjunlia vitaminophila]|uniref:HAD family hydrolase n=1 Tax=Wenjunlia vitaminophila TaxID=76728 RepID=A0A0T6LMY6_WENVI|nr:HAD-IA family hydrolase [Wenjunlia vitaminophila]KRV47466.1 HAD family hydrolase [Wenjunlia vitaminophila]
MSMPSEGLASVLAPVRHVLLDFDGPVCSVFAGVPAPEVARRLAEQLSGPDGPPPGHEESDPLAMLRRIADERDDLVPLADETLARLEMEAVDRAQPTPGGVAFLEACAASGRVVWMVSNNATVAIARYVDTHGLGRLIAGQFGRVSGHPRSMKPSPELLFAAMAAAGARPGDCIFVGDAVRDIEAAHAAGMDAIGYANKPGKDAALTRAGAAAVVTSMGELARATGGGSSESFASLP